MQLCQFDALHQSGLVIEYLEQFEQLSHAIPLYNSYYDDTYFVVRFLGGLKEEFHTAISLHQPQGHSDSKYSGSDAGRRTDTFQPKSFAS